MVGNLKIVKDHPPVGPGQIVERDHFLTIAGFPDGDMLRVHRSDKRFGIKSKFPGLETTVLERPGIPPLFYPLKKPAPIKSRIGIFRWWRGHLVIMSEQYGFS